MRDSKIFVDIPDLLPGHGPHHEEELQAAVSAASVCVHGDVNLWKPLLLCGEGCGELSLHQYP